MFFVSSWHFSLVVSAISMPTCSQSSPLNRIEDLSSSVLNWVVVSNSWKTLISVVFSSNRLSFSMNCLKWQTLLHQFQMYCYILLSHLFSLQDFHGRFSTSQRRQSSETNTAFGMCDFSGKKDKSSYCLKR